MDQDVADAITQAANEDGIDPTFALSVADRESGGNPTAPGTGTISGLFQMRGDLRQQYGGNSTDPYTQAKAWDRFITDTGNQMAKGLGRQPTPDELYYGHYFGADRAVAMINGDGNTNVADVFTPNEMQKNPNFAQAGTTGALMSSISADLASRAQKFGGADFASFGEPADDGEELGKSAGGSQVVGAKANNANVSRNVAQLGNNAVNGGSTVPLFSAYGTVGQDPAENLAMSGQGNVIGLDSEGQAPSSSAPSGSEPEVEAGLGETPEAVASAAGSQNVGHGESVNESSEPEYGMSEGELQGLRQNPGYAQMQRAQVRGGRGGQEIDLSLFQTGKNLQNAGLQSGAPQNPALGQPQQAPQGT